MARRRKTPEERRAEMAALEALWEAELAAQAAEAGYDYDIGYADGVLPDGRAWQAEVMGDTREPGLEILMLTFAIGADADWSEAAILQMVIAAGLVIPLAPVIRNYTCRHAENLDDPPLPVWWVDMTLRNADGEWARLGFALQPPLAESQYPWH